MEPTLGNPALELLEQEGIFWYILSFYMINYISKKLQILGEYYAKYCNVLYLKIENFILFYLFVEAQNFEQKKISFNS